ncbi:MAG: HAMP domain-containing protein [Anaerolineae bacterium]|nr:HAMP domain-containing protein [Anaerolineae bacterium]
MKKYRQASFAQLRGLPIQLYAFTVLPLTILLLFITFGSVALHQNDMRTLVGERDERAVQSAAAALDSEIHHRAATIASMVVFAGDSDEVAFNEILATSSDLLSDFDGGVAFLDIEGRLIASTDNDSLWDWVAQNIQSIHFASSQDAEPVISNPFIDPVSQRAFVIISAYSASHNVIAAGAFSPALLAEHTLSASYPVDSQVTIYLVDRSREVLFAMGSSDAQDLPADHPGITEALDGKSGTLYVQVNNNEHVIAYSPIQPTGWALITEEAWEAVVSPSLKITQMAPLVLVPAFLLAVFALWFGARKIVQPLQKLESKAAAVAWGDYETIKESVGGISEINQLQNELREMARKVQSAQEGLRDYIGAITSAQEEERNRLARELHDDTIQAVIALKQRVHIAQKSVKTQTGHHALDELESLAEQTIENLRRLTRALRPIYLEDLGLVTALQMLTRETSQANPLAVNFQLSGQERRLSREVELSLYRIAQEALNNVARHSKATQADLKVTFDAAAIQLEVIDNGNGFAVPKSPTDFAPSGHFGLLGMHERADLIGARLEIESALGDGTRLKVVLNLIDE